MTISLKSLALAMYKERLGHDIPDYGDGYYMRLEPSSWDEVASCISAIREAIKSFLPVYFQSPPYKKTPKLQG